MVWEGLELMEVIGLSMVVVVMVVVVMDLMGWRDSLWLLLGMVVVGCGWDLWRG